MVKEKFEKPKNKSQETLEKFGVKDRTKAKTFNENKKGKPKNLPKIDKIFPFTEGKKRENIRGIEALPNFEKLNVPLENKEKTLLLTRLNEILREINSKDNPTQEDIAQRKNIEREIFKLIQGEENAEEETPTEAPSVKETPLDPEPNLDQVENKEEKKIPQNTQEKIENTIKHLHLENSISPEFKNLTDAQQLLVLNSLKQRIIDVVQADAQTQYSEELKNKMVEVAKDAGFFAKTLTKAKNIGTGIKEKFAKEFSIKNIESELFEKLLTSEDGKKLISETTSQLIKINKDRNININEKGEPQIDFAEQLNINTEKMSEEEKKAVEQAIKEYNEIANEWRQIPYEWGQEGKKITSQEKKRFESSHRKIYDKTKEKYEEARRKILEIKTKNISNEEKGIAVYELAQISNGLQLDQLINTHPEFEKELDRLGNTAGGKEFLKSAQALTGGKGASFSMAFVAGFILRKSTKLLVGATSLGATSAGWATGIAAPITGAVIGTWKARLRGRDTLRQNEILARHGKVNESKERVAVVDAKHLTEKLNKLVDQIMNSGGEEKAKHLAMLNTRIEHTLGKIEKGQVNFGDPKIALYNQMALTESLNKATVVEQTFVNKKDNSLNLRIDSLLSHTGKGISERTSQAQKKFIEKQMIKGAIIGAVGGSLGYGFRHLGEHFGWWGNGSDTTKVNENLGIEENQNETPAEQTYSEKLDKVGKMKMVSSIHEKTNLADIFKKPNTQTTIDSSGIVKTTAPTGETITTKPSGEVTVTDTTGNTKMIEPIKIVNPDKTVTIKSPDGTTVTKDHNGNTTITNPEGNKTVTVKNDSTQNETATENNSGKTENANPENKNTEIKKPNISKNTSGIEKEFSVKLGENGVPKNLETVFNTISADRLNINADGIVDEEFAAKSLNMAANLTRLAEGHGAAGIDPEEFKQAVSYENGTLEIKDPAKFNEILDTLKEKADNSWDKGILQSKGAALSYVKNISNDNWLKIAKGDGLNEVEGVKTGIVGQDVENVKDFSNSEMVKKAGEPNNLNDLANNQTSPENITGLANEQVAPKEVENITGLSEKQTSTEGMEEITDPANKQASQENFVGRQDPAMGQTYGSQNIDKPSPQSAPENNQISSSIEKSINFKEGKTDLNLKFIYSKEGLITGVNMDGTYTPTDPTFENLIDRSELTNVDPEEIRKLRFELGELDRNLLFLKELSKGTTEYEYLNSKIIKLQKNIYSEFGKIINQENLNKKIIEAGGEPYESTILTDKEIKKVLNFQEKNISKLFKNKDLWENIKNSSYTTAKVITNMTKETIKPEHRSLHSYMLKLREITGLYPKEANYFQQDETIQEYITRCLKKALKMGKLNELKVKN